MEFTRLSMLNKDNRVSFKQSYTDFEAKIINVTSGFVHQKSNKKTMAENIIRRFTYSLKQQVLVISPQWCNDYWISH